MGLLGTQAKEPRSSGATAEELNQFNSLMKSGNNAEAAKFATGLGFSNDQIASYVGSNNYGISQQEAKNYLDTGAYKAPSAPQAISPSVVSPTGINAGNLAYGPTAPGGSAPLTNNQISDNIKRFNTVNMHADEVSGNTSPVVDDPFSFWNNRSKNSVTPNTAPAPVQAPAQVQTTAPATNYSNGFLLPALSGAQQYTDIMNFVKGNAQTPTSVQVDPKSTSAYQLEQLTSQDSPMMQLARKNGLLQAQARGDVNGSYAAGAAQAAMVQAAQSFALQDASTYNNQSLTNQAANNQFQLAGYQKGLDTAGASYLANTAALNTAALSPILTSEQIRQQSSGATDAQTLAALQNKFALEQANNSAINAQRTQYLNTYNEYLKANALQDSVQAFDKWKTETNNQNAVALAGMNNDAQLAASQISANASMYGADVQSKTSLANTAAQVSATMQGNQLQAAQNRYNTDAQFKSDTNKLINSAATTAADGVLKIIGNKDIAQAEKAPAIYQTVLPILMANQAITGSNMTMGEFMFNITNTQDAGMITSGLVNDKGTPWNKWSSSDWDAFIAKNSAYSNFIGSSNLNPNNPNTTTFTPKTNAN